MSETKINVPDGMYQAALKFQDSGIQCSAALEAALLWQRENAPVPTPKVIRELIAPTFGIPADDINANMTVAGEVAAREWSRRMYDAPEPEATDDLSPIKDLIPPMNGFPIANPAHVLMEAYRRGQKASLK